MGGSLTTFKAHTYTTESSRAGWRSPRYKVEIGREWRVRRTCSFFRGLCGCVCVSVCVCVECAYIDISWLARTLQGMFRDTLEPRESFLISILPYSPRPSSVIAIIITDSISLSTLAPIVFRTWVRFVKFMHTNRFARINIVIYSIVYARDRVDTMYIYIHIHIYVRDV